MEELEVNSSFATQTTRVYACMTIQAFWRGYASRKGISSSCKSCGFSVTHRKDAVCSWCKERLVCYECGEFGCYGDCEEPYISCCVCGDNCYGGDYTNYRFCSRSCMVGRDRY